MVVAGFAMFMSALSWSSGQLFWTVGLLCDFLPAVLFLHVFLAFPTVRLDATFERLLVGTGYLVAVGFSLARMLLGAFGPQNLLSLVDEPIHERLFEQVQLLTISGIALVAFVALIRAAAAARDPVGVPVPYWSTRLPWHYC